MWQLTKEFAFEAAHCLEGLPLSHPCGRLHGHSYRVQLVLEGYALSAVGFLQDYRELEPVKRWIDTYLDHQCLNDLMLPPDEEVSPLTGLPIIPLHSTTSEHLAQWIYEMWAVQYPFLVAVRISETAKTWCEYRPRGRG